MGHSLYYYWAVPARWRRWPSLVRTALMTSVLGLSLGLTGLPLFVWRPQGIWAGLDGLWVLWAFMLFLVLVNLAAALAGATTIALERERRTWDALVVTTTGVGAILRRKLLLRVALCAVILSLTIPFWLGTVFVVLEVNGFGPFALANTEIYPTALEALWKAYRIRTFLAWLVLRLVGHALPFVAVGLAVSSRCGRLRTALAWAGAITFGLCALAWPAWPPFTLGDSAFWNHLPRWLFRLIAWPVWPNDFSYYDNLTESVTTGLYSPVWKTDLAADVLWIGVLPLVLYCLAVRWARRSTGGG